MLKFRHFFKTAFPNHLWHCPRRSYFGPTLIRIYFRTFNELALPLLHLEASLPSTLSRAPFFYSTLVLHSPTRQTPASLWCIKLSFLNPFLKILVSGVLAVWRSFHSLILILHSPVFSFTGRMFKGILMMQWLPTCRWKTQLSPPLLLSSSSHFLLKMHSFYRTRSYNDAIIIISTLISPNSFNLISINTFCWGSSASWGLHSAFIFPPKTFSSRWFMPTGCSLIIIYIEIIGDSFQRICVHSNNYASKPLLS